MKSIPDKIIEEIADLLDCGMKCYLNISSGEVIPIPDDEDFIGMEIAPTIDEIKEDPSAYLEFETMTSHESFNVMMDFAMKIDDSRFQTQLLAVLNAKSPFKNFKLKLDSSDDYRQKWFDFKKSRYIEHVKTQIPDGFIQ
jgi:hypothetical protein